jgi:2,4-didehydro-3-deoxy-L-rhamnonate hydrolase
MQQFARVQQGNSVIPALVSAGGLLDLRPLVADITSDTIGSGVLEQVNTAVLKPIKGDLTYLAPIQGIRQIPATGYNYKKHIEEMKVAMPTEPRANTKCQR